jgi:hypothetical protein
MRSVRACSGRRAWALSYWSPAYATGRSQADASLPVVGEPQACCLGGGFAPGVNAQLAEDRGDVMVNGPLRDDQALGNLGGAETFGQKWQDL